MKLNLYYWIFLNILALTSLTKTIPDLTIMGLVNPADGIGNHSVSFYQVLKDTLKVNFYFGEYIKDNNQDFLKNLDITNKDNIGNVLLFTDLLNPAFDIPKAKIKIAYSVFESTKIPAFWVNILNNQFDAVVVPDKYIAEIYESSGITIPIFVLPLALDLDKYLSVPIKNSPNKIFTFGCSGAFIPRKNHELLLDSFIENFGNKPNVRLILHGRYQEDNIPDKLAKKVISNNIYNVEIIDKAIDQEEYFQFMRNIDTYVFISQGEAFSITPRQACALGIPCILSNNTAHKTICKQTFIKSVVSSQLVIPRYNNFLDWDTGFQFDCTKEEVSSALKDVYNHYNDFLRQAQAARQWASSYTYEKLRPYYKSLIKPKKVILGKQNEIGKDYIITNSVDLYKKYNDLVSG